MEIGTANVSAIIGAYSHPVAMTTDKFSVPYLVTSSSLDAHRRQLNVVDVLPTSVDLVAATVDLVSSAARWPSVAVLSQPDRGTRRVHST